MRGKKFLLISPAAKNCGRIAAALRSKGAEVILADSEEGGLRRLYEDRPDLILLDESLSGESGRSLCSRVRRITYRPVILLGAAADEAALMRALREGADYLLKWTIELPTLELVIRALLRLSEREPQQADGPLSCGERLVIDLQRGVILIEGQPVSLTETEYRLLAYLARHPNQVVTIDQILEQVWGWEEQKGHSRNAYVLISRLRQKIELDPGRPQILKTLYGIGYQFCCEAAD